MRAYQLTDCDARKLVTRRLQLLQYIDEPSQLFPSDSGGGSDLIGVSGTSLDFSGVDVAAGTVPNNFDLSSFYNSPSVSTTPTPGLQSTGSVLDTIDNFVGIGTSLAAVGLSQPSVSRPNRSSVLGTSSGGLGSFFLIAILAIIGFFAYKAVK